MMVSHSRAFLGFSLRLTAWSLLLQLVVTGTSAQLDVDDLFSRCADLSNIQRVLAGDLGNVRFRFLCSTSSGSNEDVEEIVWSHEPVGKPAKNFTNDLGHQLEFTAVNVSDDGLYVCYYTLGMDTNFIRSDAGCIYVFAQAQFVPCDGSPGCSETRTIQKGDTFRINVSLDFINGGSSGMQQKVNVLQLYLGGEDGERLYLCDLNHANNTCSSRDNVTVIQDNPDMWNEIVLELVAGESGEFVYTAAYEISKPRDGSTDDLLKSFTVIVNSDDDISVSSDTIDPTPVTTGTIPATSEPAVLPPTDAVHSSGDDNTTTLIGVLLPLLLLAAILVVLVVIFGIAIYRKKQNMSGSGTDSYDLQVQEGQKVDHNGFHTDIPFLDVVYDGEATDGIDKRASTNCDQVELYVSPDTAIKGV